MADDEDVGSSTTGYTETVHVFGLPWIFEAFPEQQQVRVSFRTPDGGPTYSWCVTAQPRTIPDDSRSEDYCELLGEEEFMFDWSDEETSVAAFRKNELRLTPIEDRVAALGEPAYASKVGQSDDRPEVKVDKSKSKALQRFRQRMMSCLRLLERDLLGEQNQMEERSKDFPDKEDSACQFDVRERTLASSVAAGTLEEGHALEAPLATRDCAEVAIESRESDRAPEGTQKAREETTEVSAKRGKLNEIVEAGSTQSRQHTMTLDWSPANTPRPVRNIGTFDEDSPTPESLPTIMTSQVPWDDEDLMVVDSPRTMTTTAAVTPVTTPRALIEGVGEHYEISDECSSSDEDESARRGVKRIRSDSEYTGPVRKLANCVSGAGKGKDLFAYIANRTSSSLHLPASAYARFAALQLERKNTRNVKIRVRCPFSSRYSVYAREQNGEWKPFCFTCRNVHTQDDFASRLGFLDDYYAMWLEQKRPPADDSDGSRQ